VPGVTLGEGLLMADFIFERFGLTEYDRMVTAEMARRPIPHVFRASETKALDDLFTEMYPYIQQWIIPQIKAPYQTYNKVSKVGYPGFFIPEDKLTYVAGFMPSVLAGDLAFFENAFIVQNVRIQPEQASKERDFQFIGEGGVYTATITGAERVVRTPVGRRTGGRSRLVYNLPVYNLIKQTLDSAVGDVFNKWPAFHHNMFGGDVLPVKGHHVCLDVKHFERHTSTCNRIRAAHWGGVYGACSELTARLPFAVPTDDWKGARYAYVKRDEGWNDQYGSGDSAVAPSQKEILLAIYASFFEKEFGYARASAIVQVSQGGDERLTIRNFGDDNSIDGDKGAVLAFMQFAAQYLTVEEETPPKFLGFVWYPGLGWRLPITSYLLKTYLNERRPGSNFRKYPFLGWVERRAIFNKLGHPDSREVFEFEDIELARVGVPWYKILELADKERRDAFLAKEQAMLSPMMLQNKEYLMSPFEKIATGAFSGLGPENTGRILKQLVSKDIAKQLLV